MLPFLIDVTGNTVNLYDTVGWWDDVNHFINWALLSAGIGVLLSVRRVEPPWALGLLVAGTGALLAIGWEVGGVVPLHLSRNGFICHGTELSTAYEDTLGDETLGTLGAALAGVLVSRYRRER